MSNDPFPEVAKLAEELINYVKQKVYELHRPDLTKNGRIPCISEPSSPSGRPSFLTGESPPSRANIPTSHPMPENAKPARPNRWSDTNAPYQQYQFFSQFNRIRKTFDKGPEIREGGEGTEDAQEPKCPIIESQYVAWCTGYFSQSVLKADDSDMDGPTHLMREWLYLRNETVRKGVSEERKKIDAGGRFDEQIFINKNPYLPTSVKFHPYESHMVVTDKECFSIWDWEKGYLLRSDIAHNRPNSRITALDFINPHDETLMMIGSDDGAVKIWKNYTDSDSSLVTAFQIIQDLLPSTRGSGLVLQWEQHSSKLLASGDVRHIRVWDAEKEMKVQDIPTGADSCLTCLTSIPEHGNLIVAGCGDGTVRVYDRKMPQNECCVHVFQEHSGWVVNVKLQDKRNLGQIISGSVAGDVRFWDLRHTGSIKNIPPLHGMTAMAIHPTIDLIACGAASGGASVFNHNGETVSTIKYHDGFMGNKIGPISCLAFHPYKASLAAGSTDFLISVYSVNRKH